MISHKDDKHKKIPLFPLEVLDDIVKDVPASGWSQWLKFSGLEEVLLTTEAVLEYGAKKYAPDSWQGIEPDRYKRAFIRHSITKDANDAESRLPHKWHAITNAVFLAWFEIQHTKSSTLSVEAIALAQKQGWYICK